MHTVHQAVDTIKQGTLRKRRRVLRFYLPDRPWWPIELVGRLESSVTRLEATVAIAALKKFVVGPAMPAFFSPRSDNCGCEKSVTELPAQPTGGRNELATSLSGIRESALLM